MAIPAEVLTLTESAAPEDGARVCVGMPQLGGAGLSENWLLKTCGDRHWQALARAQGKVPWDMVDSLGRRVYAAFTHVHVRRSRLAAVQEGDSLCFSLRWTPIGRAQAFSVQTIRTDSRVVAEVEMMSVFVARERPGDNHSVSRAPVTFLPPTLDSSSLVAQAQACMGAAKAIRAGAWSERFGWTPGQVPLGEQIVRPCPLNEFNGAGLLYFASFQALVDRVHWELNPAQPPGELLERQMHFHGNVNVGDALIFRVLGRPISAPGHWNWTQVIRAEDQRVVANIATHRAMCRTQPAGIERV